MVLYPFPLWLFLSFCQLSRVVKLKNFKTIFFHSFICKFIEQTEAHLKYKIFAFLMDISLLVNKTQTQFFLCRILNLFIYLSYNEENHFSMKNFLKRIIWFTSSAVLTGWYVLDGIRIIYLYYF